MDKKNYKNFLLINYGGIGDEILFLPVIASLKKKYPSSKITLALEKRAKCIKDLSKDIDDTISVDIKAKGFLKYINILKFIFSVWFKGFNCVISSGKSPFVAIILFLTGIKKRIGYKTKTSFLLTDSVVLNENQYAAKMYHDLVKPVCDNEFSNPEIKTNTDYVLDKILENREYTVLHPGVSKMSIEKNIFKCPKLSFWTGLIKDILAKGKTLVLLGTKDDSELIEEILKHKEISENENFINYFMKTKNISEMAEIMRRSKAVICVDSAPLHVAVSVGARVYAIFGPTNELKLVPDSKNVTVIKNDVSCRPCLWHKNTRNCEASECLNIDFKSVSDKIY